eukprot:c9159_g1_i1 orf=96-776(+)
MKSVRVGVQRVLDLSLVALAVGCGSVGYYWNSQETPPSKQERLRAARSLAHRRRVEKAFDDLAKQYDLKVDELVQKRDQMLKMREDMQSLSAKLLQRNKEVALEVEKLQKLVKVKEELQQLASSLRQQKRTLDAEVQELMKIVKIKEDLQARSTQTCSAVVRAEDELQMLSSKVQERNKVLEAEIEELMRLVKVKEELQAKSEALDEPVLTHLSDPILKKDDSVQG